MIRARLLWLVDGGEVPTAALAARLPAEEQQALALLRHPERARGFALSRLLLRRVLEGFPGAPVDAIRFRREPSGRLVLAGASTLHISLSHTPGLAAVAVAEAPCGVDAERPRAVDALAVARRYFAPAEAAWLERQEAGSRERAFLQLWTLKEASVKALGIGLATHMARLSFTLDDGMPRACGEAPLQVRLESTEARTVAGVVATAAPVRWETQALEHPDA